jgi:hypothetical protein
MLASTVHAHFSTLCVRHLLTPGDIITLFGDLGDDLDGEAFVVLFYGVTTETTQSAATDQNLNIVLPEVDAVL